MTLSLVQLGSRAPLRVAAKRKRARTLSAADPSGVSPRATFRVVKSPPADAIKISLGAAIYRLALAWAPRFATALPERETINQRAHLQ
jgi:hypothetical protein